ncbi:MAG: AI-2E family transporter, partial [Silicimonas sp.]|nr:AI-2E family transporter [Silicimonas sp.]
MALPVRDQLKYWGFAAVVFFVVLWLLGDVILPFVLGAAIAYFLDPVADRLERLGTSRAVAVGIITFFAILIFVVLALLIIPLLVKQTADLIEAVPEIAANLQTFLTERFPDLGDANSTIRVSLATIGETVQSKGGEVLNTVLASFSGVVNAIVLFVLVPIVAFYLLYDWDDMVARIDALLPRDHAPTIRKLAGEIDRTMAG